MTTDEALKFDHDKPPLDLISGLAMLEVGRVLAHGAEKYGHHNWRRGMAWSRLIAAALRHIYQSTYEDRDPETECLHWAHAICCLMFLIEYFELRLGKDDRHIAPAQRRADAFAHLGRDAFFERVHERELEVQRQSAKMHPSSDSWGAMPPSKGDIVK